MLEKENYDLDISAKQSVQFQTWQDTNSGVLGADDISEDTLQMKAFAASISSTEVESDTLQNDVALQLSKDDTLPDDNNQGTGNEQPDPTNLTALMQQWQKEVPPVDPQQGESSTGLPDNLKAGIENLSGLSMDNVKVHYNSSKPAQLQAHAFAQGTEIYLAPGQEKHLPHEAWHVVQQMQGRVKPTLQMKGAVPVNDNKGLEKEADDMGAKALKYGNKSDKKSLVNKSSNPSNSQQVSQMMWDKDTFKSNTDGGTFVRRGAGVQKIDKLIEAYDKMQKKWLDVRHSDLVYLHNTIRKTILEWIDYHQNESKQQERIKKFKHFLATEWQKEKQRIAMKSPVADDTLEANEFVEQHKLQYSGGSAGFFGWIITQLNKLASNNGDACKMEINVEFPAGPVKVGGGLRLEVSRDDNFTKIKGAVNLAVKAEAAIVEITGKLEGFVEAEASNAEDAVDLMSYGLYQRARNSKYCPEELVNAVWGGGDTGSSGYMTAETKAAETEKKIFGKVQAERDYLINQKEKIEAEISENDRIGNKLFYSQDEAAIRKHKEKAELIERTHNPQLNEILKKLKAVNDKIEHLSVESGVEFSLSGSVEFNDDLGAEASLALTTGTKIGLDQIEASKGKENLGKTRNRNDAKAMGEDTFSAELKAALSFLNYQGEIRYKFIKGKKKNEDGNEQSDNKFELELSGQFKIPEMKDSLMNALLPYMKTMGEKGVEFIRKNVLDSEKDNEFKSKGLIYSNMLNGLSTFNETDVADNLKSEMGIGSSDAENETFTSETSLKLSITAKTGELSLELSKTSVNEFDAIVLNGKYEKQKRLMKITCKEGASSWS